MRWTATTGARITMLTALTAVAVGVIACRDEGGATGPASAAATAGRHEREEGAFTRTFLLERCTFLDVGSNPYLRLEPGYRLVLESQDEEEPTELVVTVLSETKTIEGITTRVVEERETEDGELIEVSRNFFAICKENGSVFYFGEEVDIYEEGQIVSHEGAWLHGQAGARAGLIMPGLPLLGARYFQEIAPGVALDRARVLSLQASLRTPFASFHDVLVTEETTPLEPDASELKYYALDVGLIRDADLVLVEAGFVGATP